jgi:hypothetical protein
LRFIDVSPGKGAERVAVPPYPKLSKTITILRGRKIRPLTCELKCAILLELGGSTIYRHPYETEEVMSLMDSSIKPGAAASLLK